MFDLRNLEVSAIIEFTQAAAEQPVDPLTVHYLHLDELTTNPEELTGAIDSHLADVLTDTFQVAPDTSDPETLAFRVVGVDNTDLYRASVSLQSRSLEPRVDCEQWGITDVAEHIGVAAVTVRAYLSRDRMPAPDGHIAGSPWWDADRIRDWERPNARGRH